MLILIHYLKVNIGITKKNKINIKKGQITIGFIRLNDNNLWLLFHVGRVTRDLNKVHGVGYECEVVQVLPDTF